ncbi:MAG: DEAD/DEAH box helicase [Phycisphaerales bacterium]|nr:DEAD/DEAH box helicase [Phycisphaerales bacterium]
MAYVLHATFTEGRLHVWAESVDRWRLLTARSEPRPAGDAPDATFPWHPYGARRGEFVGLLGAAATMGRDDECVLRLPRNLFGPFPSDRLASSVGGVDRSGEPWLARFRVGTRSLAPVEAMRFLLAVTSGDITFEEDPGYDLLFWAEVARLVADRCESQRFVPSLRRNGDGHLRAVWRPWLQDEEAAGWLTMLLAAMPPVARGVDDELGETAWPRLEAALEAMTDDLIRTMLHREDFVEAIDGRDDGDPHVQWLGGLLDGNQTLPLEGEDTVKLMRATRSWIARLDDFASGQALRLRLEVHPPAEGVEVWRLDLGLSAVGDPTRCVTAQDVWKASPEAIQLSGDSDPQDVLLSELGRAAQLWPVLEPLLSQATPSEMSLSTRDAWSLLGEFRPLLEESGCVVSVPSWWGGQANTLGVRLVIESDDLDETDGPPRGMDSTVRYRWQVAVGDQPLSLEALRRLRDQQTPLVQVDGRWIEVDQKQLARAIDLLEGQESVEASLLEAMRIASDASEEETGLAILGVDASGWVASLLEGPTDEGVEDLSQPERFAGTLRPYQRTGLNWLGFLDRFGLGGCLADDMGLGKTVQLIALLQHERARAAQVGPTLLVVPTSVVGNWQRELARFAPELRTHVQHGPDRPLGEAFALQANDVDVTITTYALVARDAETLGDVAWHRVVLDEAQYIKNPPTKQARAIRSLDASRRIALTGTPVENRLSELWSIMEFCNPGFLGAAPDFRRRFARPIERHRDPNAAASLRSLVQPFVLRRLKTDRDVIDDLPECVETREYATLTPEQAVLYRAVVDSMIGQVDRTEGIQRRGLILAMLAKLKQICDHPELAESGDEVIAAVEKGAAVQRLSERSGKSRRLMTLLDEVLATGERALVFTQYRRMGRLLSAMIEHDLGCRSLFLHGGTPMKRRQAMIDEFQSPAGDAPVFVLSLKAGGLGLNLTAANHVFHFDRWWNPAVERQATDRAFRIGQTRTVHVHKFVCMGTLEERIDRMIEEKTQLAEQIIGTGDNWLTELDSSQLRDMLILRGNAMEVEA